MSKFTVDFTEVEDKFEADRRRKLAYIIRKRDEELAKQQKWDRTHVCPTCHMVLTTTGKCTNGCGED